jgi:drug/metabolite transporter (DMT)-like permease
MFIICGAFGALGIGFINAAYKNAPVAVIVPFEYTALIWAAAAGFVFWDEVPDAYAWCGAAVIMGSGLFILYRETLAPPRVDAARPNFPLQEAAVGESVEPGPDSPPGGGSGS